MFVGFMRKGGRCGVAVHRLLCKLSLYLREYSSTKIQILTSDLTCAAKDNWGSRGRLTIMQVVQGAISNLLGGMSATSSPW